MDSSSTKLKISHATHLGFSFDLLAHIKGDTSSRGLKVNHVVVDIHVEI